ncbi:UDP-2,3-diacylglucosamine diphosphatase [Pseudoalteromonas fenneropenaei]|uniref:UDP-2,3-diacylglucosamine hydrolase n=1 Tax=Pseudoalteromonas fenneropenaei TaxID=1737459 RepID=A0ABV7CN79_9GAMM
MRKSYFISDLHLSENRPDIVSAFYRFLDQHMTNEVDALYILGDFFEVWVGDDYQTQFTQDIATRLNALSQRGIALYFIHGNRDFLLGKRFAQQAGIALLPEQSVIDLYGTPTLILHGDEMCTQDLAYQAFRKKSRGWWWPRLMLALPLWYRQRVARNAREKSKLSQMNKPPEVLDVTQTGVSEMFSRFAVKDMIHGHTHRPKVHHNEILGSTRTVLGDWYNQSSYLMASENGLELVFQPL